MSENPALPTRVPSTRDRRRERGTLTITAAAAVFTLLAVAVRLGWGPMISIDAAVARDLNDLVAPRAWLVRLTTVVTTLGGASVLTRIVALALILLLIRRRFRLAGYLAVTTLGAVVLDPSIKAVFGRLRPVVPHPVAVGGGNSFPSGHSLDSLICYGAIVLVFLPALPRRWRGWLVGAAVTLIGLIGLSRIVLGVHFVSDVLGAWSLGVTWLGLSVYAFELYRSHTGRPVPQPLTEGLEPEAAPDVAPTVREAPEAPEDPEDPEGRDGPTTLRTLGLLAIAWVFILGALAGLGELLKRAGDNVLGDRTSTHWLAAHRTPALNAVSDIGSQAGDTHWILAVGLIAGVIALGIERRWRPVVFLIVTMMGELGLFLAIAKIVGRARPDVGHLDGPLPTSAYPSGHVAATLCLYAAIALLVLPRTQAWWRWLVLVPAIGMPLLVGVSRLYRGMHHPTDLVASVLLAAGWLSATYLIIRPNPPTEPLAVDSPERTVSTHGRDGGGSYGRRPTTDARHIDLEAS